MQDPTDIQRIRERATRAERTGRELIELGQITEGNYMMGRADALREVADMILVHQLEDAVR